MACTKYTEAQYLALSDAIASGAVEVSYGDKRVRYASLDDMLRIQILMERCLYPGRFNSRSVASFSKGTFPKSNNNDRRCC